MEATNATADMFFKEIQAKERELSYQQVILEGCREELASLKGKLDEETDPEARSELMETARLFASALHGKKERFLAMYDQWKSALLKGLDEDLRRDAALCIQPKP
jgi:hypothetical protein